MKINLLAQFATNERVPTKVRTFVGLVVQGIRSVSPSVKKMGEFNATQKNELARAWEVIKGQLELTKQNVYHLTEATQDS
jgi:hypothetical protein